MILYRTTFRACYCLLKKYIRIIFGSSSSNIDNWSGYYSNKRKRSFSALRYLKTYLRFTTKEARLNGLALLFVHCDLNIDFEHVIHEFSRKKS